MNQLEQARAQIDTVDRQMAALFEQRMAAVRQVIEYKQATGMPILDSGREAQVIEKEHRLHCRGGAAPLLCRPSSGTDGPFPPVSGLCAWGTWWPTRGRGGLQPHRPHPVASGQGPEPGHLDEVFDAVQDGRAAYGVIPFENSTAGDVSDVLDLLYNHSLYIVQMYDPAHPAQPAGVPGAHLRT